MKETHNQQVAELIFMMILVMVLSGCSGTRGRQADQTPGEARVPFGYRSLYNELNTKLDNLLSSVDASRDGKKSDVNFGVDLLVANSNRGEVLLTDRVFEATRLTLDRLKDLGVHSIALSIQYPILTSSFPRAGEYRIFYGRVAREIRSRGFKLVVEIGTTFREPEFSTLKVNYRGLTMERFREGLREMAAVIVADMQPDYLTLFTEPVTQSHNTGLDFTVKNFSETVISLSHKIQAEFSCFFWMKYFYGYLDYNSHTKNLTPQKRINAVDSLAGRNILNNSLGNTGKRFKTLIAPQ